MIARCYYGQYNISKLHSSSYYYYYNIVVFVFCISTFRTASKFYLSTAEQRTLVENADVSVLRQSTLFVSDSALQVSGRHITLTLILMYLLLLPVHRCVCTHPLV